ncbi:12628_t:CDS:2, partial [Acaulospora colombiana]
MSKCTHRLCPILRHICRGTIARPSNAMNGLETRPFIVEGPGMIVPMLFPVLAIKGGAGSECGYELGKSRTVLEISASNGDEGNAKDDDILLEDLEDDPRVSGLWGSNEGIAEYGEGIVIGEDVGLDEAGAWDIIEKELVDEPYNGTIHLQKQNIDKWAKRDADRRLVRSFECTSRPYNRDDESRWAEQTISLYRLQELNADSRSRLRICRGREAIATRVECRFQTVIGLRTAEDRLKDYKLKGCAPLSISPDHSRRITNRNTSGHEQRTKAKSEEDGRIYGAQEPVYALSAVGEWKLRPIEIVNRFFDGSVSGATSVCDALIRPNPLLKQGIALRRHATFLGKSQCCSCSLGISGLMALVSDQQATRPYYLDPPLDPDYDLGGHSETMEDIIDKIAMWYRILGSRVLKRRHSRES